MRNDSHAGSVLCFGPGCCLLCSLCCDGRPVALLHPGCILVDECYRSQHTDHLLNHRCKPVNPLVIAKRRKGYIRYSLFSWGFPLVVVGMCVMLQLTNTGMLLTGNAAATNQRNLPLIVLKLTVVMGISWILGFVLAFYPTPYIEYPFVIINSCQGVLICFSFVIKKNVFVLYKQRFKTETHPTN
ncbi:hypothetical protein OS493_030923 [Desmophyllum pertusum]|uniref:G-protein coupled receptors family 2 profile 2 domain-containing protein n=1 Tax=Desmophyllum pertusum TaxID=174260 RepID=A0A9W9ZX81_9CNID|nr:hypothetical protein OS493_030923 [Desmophyllum pertusum]